MIQPLCVMLVAAEASGDNLGADLARALSRRLGAGVRFVGVGGERMRQAGVESPFPISDLSILGLVEGLQAYPRVLRRARETALLARREQPDIAVLIDSWGFTLRVAKRLRRLRPDMPLVKYVGPQVWASRPGRAAALARVVDRLLSIHTFDAPYYERVGLETTFVGDSTLARDFSSADAERARRRIGVAAGQPILLLLPGSRPAEIRRMLAPLRGAAERLSSTNPDLHIAVSVASTVTQEVKAGFASFPGALSLIEDETSKRDVMKAATVAIACSGSVTTELALAGCPIIVGYRLGLVTHLVLKRLITTKYITLLNIAAEKAIAPEFVQSDCTAEALAQAAALRLDNPQLRARQIADQHAALDRMGRGQVGEPAERAATAVLEIVERQSERRRTPKISRDSRQR